MVTLFSIVVALRSTRLGLSLCVRALHRFLSWTCCQPGCCVVLHWLAGRALPQRGSGHYCGVFAC